MMSRDEAEMQEAKIRYIRECMKVLKEIRDEIKGLNKRIEVLSDDE